MKLLLFMSLLFSGNLLFANNLDSISEQAYVSIGSGGGFTGLTTEYHLFKDGNVYKFNSLENQKVWVKKLNKKEMKCVFKKLDALHLEDMDYNHPGNISYFIEKRSGEKVNRITWGGSGTTPEKPQAFYEFLMSKISKQ